MDRKKKMVLLSHCILNVNAKVEGLDPYPCMMKELIDVIHREGYGVIQLPCPEMILYGIRRWGMVKEQMDCLYAKEQLRMLIQPILYQMDTYLRSGYRIPFVIGIDGSPSCGVHFTCSNPDWKGEMSTFENIEEILAQVARKEEMGVFMELLRTEFVKQGFDISFLAVDEKEPETSITFVEEKLKSLF